MLSPGRRLGRAEVHTSWLLDVLWWQITAPNENAMVRRDRTTGLCTDLAALLLTLLSTKCYSSGKAEDKENCVPPGLLSGPTGASCCLGLWHCSRASPMWAAGGTQGWAEAWEALGLRQWKKEKKAGPWKRASGALR